VTGRRDIQSRQVIKCACQICTCTLFEGCNITANLQFREFPIGIRIAVALSSSTETQQRVRVPQSGAIMSRQEAEGSSAESEYLTVPELAKMVRRNRKTVYGWIATGEIGEADGLFVVQGRFLIHWPTFRAKQFRPREKLRGQVPDFSEETENGVARNGQTRSITDRV
jgi:hypothetical protein